MTKPQLGHGRIQYFQVPTSIISTNIKPSTSPTQSTHSLLLPSHYPSNFNRGERPFAMSTVPLKFPRLVSLFFLACFGVVGMCVGINALAKSNQQKDFLRKNAPSGATVNIDTSDVVASGTVITVACGLLALTSFLIFVPLLLLPKGASTRALSTRTLPIQTSILGFLTIWLFATLIPFTDFVATRQAKVTAFLGSVQLPQSIIQAAQKQLGVTGVYKDIGYRESFSTSIASIPTHGIPSSSQCDYNPMDRLPLRCLDHFPHLFRIARRTKDRAEDRTRSTWGGTGHFSCGGQDSCRYARESVPEVPNRFVK